MEQLFDYVWWYPTMTWFRIFYVEQDVYYAAYLNHSKLVYYDRDAPDFYFTKEGKKWVSTPEVNKELLKDLVQELIHFKVMKNWSPSY